MIYYLFFLVYLAAGITICGILFSWAVRNGQFKDQDRARYLPLAGESPQPAGGAASKWPGSLVVTVALILAALAAQVAVVLYLSLAGA